MSQLSLQPRTHQFDSTSSQANNFGIRVYQYHSLDRRAYWVSDDYNYLRRPQGQGCRRHSFYGLVWLKLNDHRSLEWIADTQHDAMSCYIIQSMYVLARGHFSNSLRWAPSNKVQFQSMLLVSVVDSIYLALHRPGTWSHKLFNNARQLSSTVRRLGSGPLTDSRLFPSLRSWAGERIQPHR